MQVIFSMSTTANFKWKQTKFCLVWKWLYWGAKMISLFVMHVVYQEAIHVYHFVSMAKKYYMKLYFWQWDWARRVVMLTELATLQPSYWSHVSGIIIPWLLHATSQPPWKNTATIKTQISFILQKFWYKSNK